MNADKDYQAAKTTASSSKEYHSSVVTDATDAMNNAYKTYEDASTTRKTTIDLATNEIYTTSSISKDRDSEYQTAHNSYISASNSSIAQEIEDNKKVGNASINLDVYSRNYDNYIGKIKRSFSDYDAFVW